MFHFLRPGLFLRARMLFGGRAMTAAPNGANGPRGIAAIDLMLQIPMEDPTAMYEFLKPLLLDRESREQFKFPAEYMFKDVPKGERSNDYVRLALDAMDKVGIERAMIGVDKANLQAQRALKEHPNRFFGSYHVNPNLGM